MKIYLAGPISGKSYDEVVDLYRGKAELLRHYGYDVLCPMTGKTHLRNELDLKAYGLNDHPTSTNHGIFERDKWMVSNCDIVLADLSNAESRISIGTMMELAWAAAYGKHSVVVMQADNIHQHAFVLEAADMVFPDIEQAVAYLAELAKGI
jgi:nucleoside 2-deoxyribosyltransferase